MLINKTLHGRCNFNVEIYQMFKQQQCYIITANRNPDIMKLINQYGEKEGLKPSIALSRFLLDALPELIAGNITIKKQVRHVATS